MLIRVRGYLVQFFRFFDLFGPITLQNKDFNPFFGPSILTFHSGPVREHRNPPETQNLQNQGFGFWDLHWKNSGARRSGLCAFFNTRHLSHQIRATFLHYLPFSIAKTIEPELENTYFCRRFLFPQKVLIFSEGSYLYRRFVFSKIP